MPHDPRKCLDDMLRAATFLRHVVEGKTIDDYRGDEILRCVVERKFEIIGEALNRLAKLTPDIAGQVPQARQIISFRNILIHGYDIVEEQIVWDIVERDLPNLLEVIPGLLEKFAQP